MIGDAAPQIVLLALGGVGAAGKLGDVSKLGELSEAGGVVKNVKTVEDILKDASPGRITKGKTTQYTKPGTYKGAIKEFDSLNPKNIKKVNTKYGAGRIGILPDGRKVIVRPGSSDGRPTLEIRESNGRGVEIRYGK